MSWRRSAAVAAAAVLILGACGERDPFEQRSFGEIEQAFTDQGVNICNEDSDNDHANQAVRSRQYRVAIDCQTDDDAKVVVDEFAQAEDRDAAARNFEVQARPRAGGQVYTLGHFSVLVSGQLDDDVVDRVTKALKRIGAE